MRHNAIRDCLFDLGPKAAMTGRKEPQHLLCDGDKPADVLHICFLFTRTRPLCGRNSSQSWHVHLKQLSQNLWNYIYILIYFTNLWSPQLESYARGDSWSLLLLLVKQSMDRTCGASGTVVIVGQLAAAKLVSSSVSQGSCREKGRVKGRGKSRG